MKKMILMLIYYSIRVQILANQIGKTFLRRFSVFKVNHNFFSNGWAAQTRDQVNGTFNPCRKSTGSNDLSIIHKPYIADYFSFGRFFLEPFQLKVTGSRF